MLRSLRQKAYVKILITKFSATTVAFLITVERILQLMLH